MSAFAVIYTTLANAALDAKVPEVYPNDSHRVSPTVWLIADKDITTQGVCRKLTIESGGIDNVMVVKVESYWGIAPKNIWEWLAVKGSDT